MYGLCAAEQHEHTALHRIAEPVHTHSSCVVLIVAPLGATAPDSSLSGIRLVHCFNHTCLVYACCQQMTHMGGYSTAANTAAAAPARNTVFVQKPHKHACVHAYVHRLCCPTQVAVHSKLTVVGVLLVLQVVLLLRHLCLRLAVCSFGCCLHTCCTYTCPTG
jgi:hypothetical protein